MNTHRRNQLPSHVASHYAIAPSYEPEPPRKKKGGSVLSNILLVVGLALILVAGLSRRAPTSSTSASRTSTRLGTSTARTTCPCRS